MLSQMNQSQKTTYYLISFIQNVQNRQTHRDSDRLGWEWWGRIAGEEQRMAANGYWVSLQGDKMF